MKGQRLLQAFVQARRRGGIEEDELGADLPERALGAQARLIDCYRI
jgi:hypothetical protein